METIDYISKLKSLKDFFLTHLRELDDVYPSYSIGLKHYILANHPSYKPDYFFKNKDNYNENLHQWANKNGFENIEEIPFSNSELHIVFEEALMEYVSSSLAIASLAPHDKYFQNISPNGYTNWITGTLFCIEIIYGDAEMNKIAANDVIFMNKLEAHNNEFIIPLNKKQIEFTQELIRRSAYLNVSLFKGLVENGRLKFDNASIEVHEKALEVFQKSLEILNNKPVSEFEKLLYNKIVKDLEKFEINESQKVNQVFKVSGRDIER